MTAYDAVSLANIINNIVCSLIGCSFLFRVSKNVDGHKKQASICFFLLFFFLGIAFATLTMRAWLPIIFSIFFNNALYLCVSYMMLFGVMCWYNTPPTRRHFIIFAIHVILLPSATVWLYLYSPSFIARVYLTGGNNAIINFILFLFCWRNRTTNGSGEKMLVSAALMGILVSLLPSTLMTITHDTSLFLVSIIISQNVACYFVLGALLSLYLFDQIDWHYHRSIRDELTGLYNRRYFNERLNAMSSGGLTPGVIAIVDIDHFKRVNDSFGHDVGDKIIQHVSRTLLESLPEDTLLARYGGEEFICYLPDCNNAVARGVLNQLRTRIATLPLMFSGHNPCITVSVGYSATQAGEPFTHVIKQADIALYEAKRLGRNGVIGLEMLSAFNIAAPAMTDQV